MGKWATPNTTYMVGGKMMKIDHGKAAPPVVEEKPLHQLTGAEIIGLFQTAKPEEEKPPVQSEAPMEGGVALIGSEQCTESARVLKAAAPSTMSIHGRPAPEPSKFVV